MRIYIQVNCQNSYKMNNNLISLSEEPISLFEKWYAQATKAEINDPNAMNLSTVCENNKPSSRIVLLKSFNKHGFIFYTNSSSRKGKTINNNKFVSLNFHWKSILKQVRIEGTASMIEGSISDEYFNSRPFESRIGAWASSQSSFLKNRSELLKKIDEIKIKFTKDSIYRPKFWNGYIVKPDLIEFWQDMPFRLHDRVEFKKTKKGWESRNLYP